MVCFRPYLRGISKSRSVASCIPICTMLMTKSAPSRAIASVEMFFDRGMRIELRGRPARHHARSLQALHVDVMKRNRDVPQFGKFKDVGDQVLHEYDTAGADHGNFQHVWSFLGMK